MTQQTSMLEAINLKKQLVVLALLLNILVILYFWLTNNMHGMFDDSGQTLTVFGRLFGLLAAALALVQFTTMSRAGWLEGLFGMDKLAIFHRLNGYAVFIFIILHPLFISNGYALMAGIGYIEQTVQLFYLHPSMPFAFLASLLFTLVVISSVYIVRKHLKFESWYFLHLLVYAAIVAAFFHQVVLGADFLGSQAFEFYWYALYFLVFLNLLTSRFGKISWQYLRHRFEVQKVTTETADSSSVYISGRNIKSFTSKGGQFVLVRFLRPGMWWQEHPFSLSAANNGQGVRLTIKRLGDFTKQINDIKPGTKVAISGPFGVFINERSYHDKKLFIAGGIGITPIFSMIDEASSKTGPSNDILIYGNKKWSDVIFAEDLIKISKSTGLQVHHVLSAEKSDKAEAGYIDGDKISRLVGDIKDRDIYICGPPAMLRSVLDYLDKTGIDPKYIHYEAFSLHQ